MSIEKYKVLTTGSVVSQLRDGLECEFIRDTETGMVWIPMYAEVAEVVKSKGKPSSKAAKDEDEDEDDDDKKPAKGKGGKPAAAAPKGKGKPAKEEEEDDEPSEIAQVIIDLDAGDMRADKAVAKLVTLTGSDKKTIQKMIDQFVDTDDVSAEELTASLEELVEGEEDEDDKKPAKGKGKPAVAAKGKAKKGEEVVEADDLEVGDKVKVWWGEDADEGSYDEYFEGKVTKIVKGVPHIKYEDGETAAINPDLHTEIIRLS